jgi:hypothetical protein
MIPLPARQAYVKGFAQEHRQASVLTQEHHRLDHVDRDWSHQWVRKTIGEAITMTVADQLSTARNSHA